MSSTAKYPDEVTSQASVELTDYFLGYRPGVPGALARFSASAISAWLISLTGTTGRPLLTGYTGGTATDIHSVATVDLAVGTVILAPNMPAGERQWQVIADPVVEDIASGIIRPTDYHATTNAKGLQLF
jgi:hypothetical protein